MRKISTLIFIVISFILFACNGITPVNEKADRLLAKLHQFSHAPGVVAAVGHEGHLVWSKGLGFADLEQRVPANPARTKFRIGSVSKTMTAVAVGKLVEQGKLDLDARVQKYVPDFPTKRFPVTTREVAGHLAGIRHYKAGEFYNKKHYENVNDGLSFFKDDPLLFEPGEKYAYSSYGWNLISAIVENASGINYLKYMQDSVFTAMAMKSTVADQVDSLILFRSRYYDLKKDSSQINSPWVDNSYKWAGGGFLSTADDLVRFGFAHLNATILNPQTIQLLWKSQKTHDGNLTNYGLGWSSGVDKTGRKWVGHGGGSVGGTTFFRVYPEEQIVLTVIANLSGARFGDYPEQLADLFLAN